MAKIVIDSDDVAGLAKALQVALKKQGVTEFDPIEKVASCETPPTRERPRHWDCAGPKTGACA